MEPSKKNSIVLVFLAFLLLVCLFPIANAIRPKTPKGVDLSPLLSLKFKGNINIANNLESNFSDKMRGPVEIGYKDSRTYSFKAQNNKNPFCVHREIQIQQWKTNEDVLIPFNDTRDTCTIFRGKIYKEETIEDVRYCIIYEPPYFDFVKGTSIPYWFTSKPVIRIVVIKNNLFVEIYYGADRKYGHYIEEINEDIAYAASILKSTAVDETAYK